MAELEKVIFAGGSGTRYNFTAYSNDTDFNPVGAVYVITKRYQNNKDGYSYSIIYIGQTGDLSERFDDHHKSSCFSKYNANSICIFPEENEQRRLDIESDLLDNYSPPCND